MASGRLRVAVFGANGQVASALVQAAMTKPIELVARGRTGADLTDSGSIDSFLRDVQPAVVINAAAYTAVDKAETDREAAFRLNAEGPAALAQLCARRDVPLIHISTDYVFDGSKRTPYLETDPIAPLGVYGASKAEGEAAVRDALPRHIIVRTSWVYYESGQNFLRTMLRLAETRDEIGVVNDQHGTPTYAGDLAEAILAVTLQLPERDCTNVWGTYHLTNSGETTWAGFAEEIFMQTERRGWKSARVRPIATADYPTPARRPGYSVLDNSKIAATLGIRMPAWQDALQRCLGRMG